MQRGKWTVRRAVVEARRVSVQVEDLGMLTHIIGLPGMYAHETVHDAAGLAHAAAVIERRCVVVRLRNGDDGVPIEACGIEPCTGFACIHRAAIGRDVADEAEALARIRADLDRFRAWLRGDVWEVHAWSGGDLVVASVVAGPLHDALVEAREGCGGFTADDRDLEDAFSLAVDTTAF